ncbi:MAG: tetratricopeptide repeat protein [Planctomycetes bacterium]|nr:tetratricopeptide repeat protein [Planctomycetota bacterium]
MPTAHNNLGIALVSQGKLDRAISHYRLALQINPNSANVHNNFGTALRLQGKLDEAVAHFTEALRINPDLIDAMNALAWYFATHKENNFYNPKEAIRLAERVCELTNYDSPILLDTLAVAYASDGRFPEAIAVSKKAVNFAVSAGQEKLTEEIRNRIKLYKNNQPYIEPSRN